MSGLPIPIRANDDAYNRKDVDGMLACSASDVSFSNTTCDVFTDDDEGNEAIGKKAWTALTHFEVREQLIIAHTTVLEIS